MTGTFSCSIEVPAPPETVFEYFTDAELLISWIGDYALLDAQPGGEFTLNIEGTPVRGQFVEVIPAERVVVSWGHAGSTTLPPGSTEVEFSLTPTPDGGTLVEVEHRNLPTEHLPSHRTGWPMFMDRLRNLGLQMVPHPSERSMTAVDDDLTTLVAATNHLTTALAGINDEQWTLPTPCDDWNLRELVDHVTGGNWFTVAILNGESAIEALSKTTRRFDGGSPTADEAGRAAVRQLDTFQKPDVLERTWDHVAGALFGRDVLRLRLHDLIVHAWDLDRTLDTTARLPHKLANWGIAELEQEDSLSATHFGITDFEVQSDEPRPDIAYLGAFGRTPVR